MIECQVIQGCEVGITVRHNGNVDILRLCFASVFLVTSNPTANVCGGTLSIGSCT